MEHDHMIILSNPRFKYIGEPQENAKSHMNYMAFEYFFERFNYLVYAEQSKHIYNQVLLLLLFIVVYSRILIGWEPTMNFSYFSGGVSTWQIIIVFVMCSRHQSYLPLFVMFVWAFTTDFGKGVCSVCSLNCGFASVSAEQIE